ncbi:TadE family protein [Methylolobus aquaticus]
MTNDRGNPRVARGSGPNRQRGAQAVDFALTFFSFIVILVGLVELIRALWMWNLLGEATRRAARVAAVCDINSPAIYRAATDLPGLGLQAGNIALTYRYCVPSAPMSTSCDGFNEVAFSSGQPPAADQQAAIHDSPQIFVRVGIRDYAPSFMLLFPWEDRDDGGRGLLRPPETFLRRFETTLPAESLGWNPEGGADGRGAFASCP